VVYLYGKLFGEIKKLFQRLFDMWAQIINILVGLWVIVSPSVLDLNKAISNNDRIVGPIIVTVAFIAISESVRNTRYINILSGLWLLISPWVLGYEHVAGILNDMIFGLIVIILSLVKGTVKNAFGGGWNALFQDIPSHVQEANAQTSKG
jgi:hypothetical protein